MNPHLNRPRLSPRSALDCRALSRGAVGDLVDARSKEGRFLKQAEAELLAQIGGEPSFTQRTLVRRAARLMLAAEKLDRRFTGEIFTMDDFTSAGGVSEALRAILHDLGLQPQVRA